MDVIQLLKKDHKMMKEMFKKFENLKGRTVQKKLDLIVQIKQALTAHAQVEEELVYPAFMENRSMKEQVHEALEEHHVTKMLLAELDELQPDDERYDAKVKVLCEYLMHHVKEEEKEMFPAAQKRLSTKRLTALGEEVKARRNELRGKDKDEDRQKKDSRRDKATENIPDMKESEGKNVKNMKDQRSKQHAA